MEVTNLEQMILQSGTNAAITMQSLIMSWVRSQSEYQQI